MKVKKEVQFVLAVIFISAISPNLAGADCRQFYADKIKEVNSRNLFMPETPEEAADRIASDDAPSGGAGFITTIAAFVGSLSGVAIFPSDFAKGAAVAGTVTAGPFVFFRLQSLIRNRFSNQMIRLIDQSEEFLRTGSSRSLGLLKRVAKKSQNRFSIEHVAKLVVESNVNGALCLNGGHLEQFRGKL